MKRTLLIFLFAFAIVARVDGNTFELSDKCKNAYEQVFLLNFKQAEKLLQEERAVHPENAAVYYIQNHIEFLKAFISEEDAAYELSKKNADIHLKEIEKVDSNNPWKNLAKGEIFLQSAVLKLKLKEYLSAGYYIRKSFKVLEENQLQFPNFIPNNKPLGFFHAVIGSVPENYKWLANLAGMRGTISQGADELSKVLKLTESNPEYNFLHQEVLFLNIFIATHLQKDPEAAMLLLNKFDNPKEPKGALQIFIESNTNFSAGKYNAAIEILQEYQPSSSSYPLYYLHYMKGMLLMNKLDSTAILSFRKYVDNYKGKSFVKSAWHKIAWLNLIDGNEKGFWSNLEMVLVKGNDFTDEDKQAMKEATSKEKPNVVLLRSRLLFDGGNYNAALSELASKPTTTFPTLKDQIEFTYRLARIFDKKGQPDKAIHYYSGTYENGKNLEWYFAANAALLLGNIYEEKNNKTLATEWYKKCLALRNHEYQNSIDQKAEAGMNRLRQ